MITSKQNTFIRQFRENDGLIAVEGGKLVREALTCGFVPKLAMFTEKSQGEHSGLFAELSEKVGDCFVITPYLAEYISDTNTPQGVFVKFERKQPFIDLSRASRIVVLDCVQDPGNAGAIMRSCEAFGFDLAVFSQTSAEAFSPKVVRASAGSVFRLPVLRGELRELIPNLKKSGFVVWGAALDDTAVSLKNAVLGDKTAVVIGNEGKGISDEVLALCDGKLYIPIKGVQSLNAGVAAGIICYEVGCGVLAVPRG
ncbi:MAG: RNA methyltransferase [Oscillospiraceae bacterium]|nr:RNA methyltransferase [Oscillospiraceae bacterium]